MPVKANHSKFENLCISSAHHIVIASALIRAINMIDFLATELMVNQQDSDIEAIVEEGFEWVNEMETFLIGENIAIPIIDEDKAGTQ